MDNHHTNSNDVYEQYVDASVALFMKYYCDTLYEGVTDRDSTTEDDTDTVFPAELDARCRILIKKAVKRQNIRKRAKYTGKVLRHACSFLIVCMALASFLFVSVDAVRVPIINYYIEHSENNFLEIGDYDNSAGEALEDTFDVSDPLSGLIPDDYALIMQEGNSVCDFKAIYKNVNESSIFISAYPLTGVSDIDMQGTEKIEYFQIYNCKAVMAEENNIIRLVWINEENSTTFTIILSGNTDLDAVRIADQLIRKTT